MEEQSFLRSMSANSAVFLLLLESIRNLFSVFSEGNVVTSFAKILQTFWKSPCDEISHRLEPGQKLALEFRNKKADYVHLQCGCLYCDALSGTMYYRNGIQYEGDLWEGKRSGFGVFKSPFCELIYEGYWKNDEPTKGKLQIHPERTLPLKQFIPRSESPEVKSLPPHRFWKDIPLEFRSPFEKKFYQYDGEFDRFEQHGYGKEMHLDGGYYVGGFVGGLKHGLGTYITPNVCYKAQWENDKMNGRAEIFWGDSFKYEGVFENDVPRGRGMLFEMGTIDWDKMALGSRPTTFEEPLAIKRHIAGVDIQDTSNALM